MEFNVFLKQIVTNIANPQIIVENHNIESQGPTQEQISDNVTSCVDIIHMNGIDGKKNITLCFKTIFSKAGIKSNLN